MTFITPPEYYFDHKSNLIRSNLDNTHDNSTDVWLLGKYSKATLYSKDKNGESRDKTSIDNLFRLLTKGKSQMLRIQ